MPEGRCKNVDFFFPGKCLKIAHITICMVVHKVVLKTVYGKWSVPVAVL